MPNAEQISEVVDRWFAERIKCGAIASHTPTYNQAFAALPDLKARLAEILPVDMATAAGVTKPQTAATAASEKEE